MNASNLQSTRLSSCLEFQLVYNSSDIFHLHSEPKIEKSGHLTSIYLAQEVKSFHDLVSVSLSKSCFNHFAPRMCVPTNFISSGPSNAPCCLTSEPFTVLSVKFHAFCTYVSVQISFPLVSLSFQYYPSLSSPTNKTVRCPSVYILMSFFFAGFMVYTCLFHFLFPILTGHIGRQQLCFGLTQSLYPFCLESCQTRSELSEHLLNKSVNE